MMIWKQCAKLVMHTSRWVLKHPVYGIMILRLGIYASRPNVSKLCSFIGSTDPSILISVILENKVLASISCFQKICLLSMNDLCFLMTITCWPSRSFFLFSFCFIFFLMHVCKKKKKTIHPSLSMRKAFFFVHLRSYTRKKLFSLYTHALKNSFSLYWHGLYKIFIPFQKFLFPFSIYTRCLYKNFLNIHSLLIYKNFFSHIVYIEKFIFFSLYTDMTFCSQRLFLSLFLALLRRLFVLFLGWHS